MAPLASIRPAACGLLPAACCLLPWLLQIGAAAVEILAEDNRKMENINVKLDEIQSDLQIANKVCACGVRRVRRLFPFGCVLVTVHARMCCV
jgi:hypothetical protein